MAIEIQRLQLDWQHYQAESSLNLLEQTDNQADLIQLLGQDYRKKFDLFEYTQLQQVITVCKKSQSLAEAGRRLFNMSRMLKSNCNDSHRLRQYLAKYGIRFAAIALLNR